MLSDDQPKKTQLIVIGTVHQPTSNFTKRQLTTVLEGLFPAVILFEVDSSFINSRSHQLRPTNSTSLEGEAIRDLQARFPVPLRPYDIEGRNQIYRDQNYFNLQKAFDITVSRLYREHQLGPEARSLYEEILALDQKVSPCVHAKLEIINSANCDAAMQAKMEKSKRNVRKIIELTPSLAEFTEYAKFDEEFWTQRNDTMVRNILNEIKYFPGQRIVVVGGCAHRYYLRSLLKPLETRFGFTLRDFWEFQ